MFQTLKKEQQIKISKFTHHFFLNKVTLTNFKWNSTRIEDFHFNISLKFQIVIFLKNIQF